MRVFTKAGLVALRSGRILLFRKRRGTTLLILPGGKLEAGETAEDALVRELSEEMTGAVVSNLRFLGTYQHGAAGEDAQVRIELFAGDLQGEPAASSEIAEVVWFDCHVDDWSALAPSLRENVFPDLLSRGVLPAR